MRTMKAACLGMLSVSFSALLAGAAMAHDGDVTYLVCGVLLHLEAIGHPVMGDPRYGRGNRDGRPMRLASVEAFSLR